MQIISLVSIVWSDLQLSFYYLFVIPEAVSTDRQYHVVQWLNKPNMNAILMPHWYGCFWEVKCTSSGVAGFYGAPTLVQDTSPRGCHT
jgi:hypothetical protein